MTMYAMYSTEQSIIAGRVVYLDENGKEVICTAVSNDKDFKHTSFKDKIFLGEVTKFVKRLEYGTYRYRAY